MINKNYILGIGAGAVSGFVFGYFVGDKIYNKVKSYIESKKTSEYVVDEEALEERKRRALAKIRKYQDEQSERFMASYLKQAERYSGSEDGKLEQVIEETRKEEHPMEGDIRTEPYLITISEFVNEHPEYDKVTLSYFAEDDTLVDDNENILHIEDTISRECLNQFLTTNPDDTIVTFYVRKESCSVDYEVLWMNRSFMEVWENGNDE